MTEYVKIFWDICINCIWFNGSILFLLYGLFVLFLAFILPDDYEKLTSDEDNPVPPMIIGDIGTIDLLRVKPSLPARLLFLMTNALKIESFLKIINGWIHLIKIVLGINNGRYNSFYVLRSIVIFYFIIIPLPSAFMTPANYIHAKPDSHLLVALILLIFTNAIGDLVSTKFTIHFFSKTVEKCKTAISTSNKRETLVDQIITAEIPIYMTALRDLVIALAVLFAVLACSSILFGVQIGEYKFSFDPHTIAMMFDRAIRFPELYTEPYCFKGDVECMQTGKGFAGMFYFAVTTFLPTLAVISTLLLWLLAVPVRIVLYFPKKKFYRIMLAETCIISACLIVTNI